MVTQVTNLGAGGALSGTAYFAEVVRPSVGPQITVTAPSPMTAGTQYQLTCVVDDDDGDPSITFAWDDGGAGGTFLDNTAQNPQYTPVSGAPLVTLTCQATNSKGVGQDSALSAVHWAPSGPSVNIPATVEMYDSAACSSDITDEGNPAADRTWSVSSGIFGSVDPTEGDNTTYTPTTPGGPNVLQTITCTFTNSTGFVQASDQIQHFKNDVSNVNATAQSNGAVGVPLSCNVTWTPGTHPVGETVLWTKATGPGNVSFDDDTKQNPNATFDAEGTYTLQATVSDIWSDTVADVTANIVISNDLAATIDVFDANPVEGVPTQVFVSVSGGVPPYSITWSATKQGGGGTPPVFDDPNAANTNVTYAVGAGEVGAWDLRVDVQDSAGTPDTDFDIKVQTVAHVVTDTISTNRNTYELAVDGSVNASASVNGSDLTGTYTWAQVGGAGELTFTPNGTNAAGITTITSSGQGSFTANVTYDNGRDPPVVSSNVTVVVHEAGWTPPSGLGFIGNMVQPLVTKFARRNTG